MKKFRKELLWLIYFLVLFNGVSVILSLLEKVKVHGQNNFNSAPYFYWSAAYAFGIGLYLALPHLVKQIQKKEGNLRMNFALLLITSLPISLLSLGFIFYFRIPPSYTDVVTQFIYEYTSNLYNVGMMLVVTLGFTLLKSVEKG